MIYQIRRLWRLLLGCDGSCCRRAERLIRENQKGWDGPGFYYMGQLIVYCPWCGGRLK